MYRQINKTGNFLTKTTVKRFYFNELIKYGHDYTDFAKAFDRILYHFILLNKMDALDKSKNIFRRISLYSLYNN